LKYNLKDYTTKNKFQTKFKESFLLSFNYIITESFTGEIIDLLTNSKITLVTIKNERNKFSIIDVLSQKTFPVNYKFIYNEFYQFEVYYCKNVYAVKIYILKNKEKTLEYQNIYSLENENNFNNIDFTKIYLFGGKFYINEITFSINNNIILLDHCNPLLQMNLFGG
jgi:hypothetical protein